MATDRDGEQFTASRLERIDHRRDEAIAPENLDESKKETVEESSDQIASLKMQARHLENLVSADLPNVYYNNDAGETRERKPTLAESLSWLNDGTLVGYLDRELRMKYPEKTERQLRILGAQKVRYLERAQKISEQVEKILSDTEKKEWQDLSEAEQSQYLEEAKHNLDQTAVLSEPEGDAHEISIRAEAERIFQQGLSEERLSDYDQRMVRIFNFFRLRELVESRVKRSWIQSNLEDKEQDVEDAWKQNCPDMQEDYEEEAKLLQQQLFDEIHSSPEAYYDYWGQELLEAQRAFTENGTIYETKSVASKVNKIISMLHTGQAVFIHGETGSGKTEIAKYISKNRMGKEPTFVQGRRSLEFSEMAETQQIELAVQQLPEEQRAEINQRIQQYIESPDFAKDLAFTAEALGLSEEEARANIIRDLSQRYVEYFKNPVEVGSKLQPIYEAAKEGRMVIIDEMNAIPHHTLIALNDLLTRKPVSEEIYGQYQEKLSQGMSSEDAIKELGIDEAHHIVRPIYGHEPILIAPGFCVVATGNWKPEDGVNYIGRQAIDTAFLRRFGVVSYDYLPNPTEGRLETPEGPDVERAQKQEAELYRMLSVRLINNNLTAELPKDAFDQIENLAQVAKVIQDGFSGKSVPAEFEPESLSGTRGKLKIEEVLRENVLDLGKLTQYVIEPWKKDGFRYPLEAYIFDRYITRSSARLTEMIFLYKTFQLRGFFQSEQGWPELIDLTQTAGDGSPSNVADLKSLQSQKVQAVLEFGNRLENVLYNKTKVDYSQEKVGQLAASEKVFFSVTDVIGKIVGQPPERKRYPNFARAMQREGEGIEGVELNPAEEQRIKDLKEEVDTLEADMYKRLEVFEKNPLSEELQASLGGEVDYCKSIVEKVEQFKALLDKRPAQFDGKDGIDRQYKLLAEAVSQQPTT